MPELKDAAVDVAKKGAKRGNKKATTEKVRKLFSCRLPLETLEKMDRLSDLLGVSQTKLVCDGLAELFMNPNFLAMVEARTQMDAARETVENRSTAVRSHRKA
jgi:hypothetical protein